MSTSDNTLQQIMNEIEVKATKQTCKMIETNTITKSNIQTILQQGASDFKEKTGREMTYSEMRAMFG